MAEKEKFAGIKTQTFGVEIEMADITREKVARIIADYFGTPESIGQERSYHAWTALDNKGRKWKAVSDASIHDANGGAELVTPILTYDDMEDLQEIVRKLRKAGAKSNAHYECGVHIHIGADGHDARSLRTLSNIMAGHESLIVSALGISQRRLGRWCKPVDPDFVKRLNAEKPKTMAQLANVWYQDYDMYYDRGAHYHRSRYHMLNLHSVFTKGTIEFRLFQFDLPNPETGKQGGLHAGQLKAYIQFCLALSNIAKVNRSASPREPQTENPKFAMRTWLIRLGFIGDEYKTARDVFTRRLEGSAAWRFSGPAGL